MLSCSMVCSALLLFLFLSLAAGQLLEVCRVWRSVRMRKIAVIVTHISIQPLWTGEF